MLHTLIAILLLADIALIALRSPRAAVLITFAFLPFLAMTRRILIPYDGWHSADPLLLVTPAVAIVLLMRRTQHGVRNSGLTRCVIGLSAWTLLMVINPLGGGIRANVAGLIFIGAPLLWFFVGRDIADRRMVNALMTLELCLSGIVAAYGLVQTSGHWPSWDTAWLQTAGYSALHVGDLTRAFGTFSSSAEYTSFVSLGIALAVGMALHRRPIWLALVPLLGLAAFLDGSRGIIVLTVGAALLQLSMRTKRPVLGALVLLVGVVAVMGGMQTYKSRLVAHAQSSGNAIVQHQINGLTSPLDSSQSSLPAHWSLFANGIVDSFARPLGSGPGSTNAAGSHYGILANPTEVDISNEFSALGIPGGILFIGIVLLVWKRVVSLYRRSSDGLVLCAAGVLFVLFGQWLNGGYYAIAPFVWLLIGWIEGEWSRSKPSTQLS